MLGPLKDLIYAYMQKRAGSTIFFRGTNHSTNTDTVTAEKREEAPSSSSSSSSSAATPASSVSLKASTSTSSTTVSSVNTVDITASESSVDSIEGHHQIIERRGTEEHRTDNKTAEKKKEEINMFAERLKENAPMAEEEEEEEVVELLDTESNSSSVMITKPIIINEDTYDGNDIEMQIKSSIMLKKRTKLNGMCDGNLMPRNVVAMIDLGSTNDVEVINLCGDASGAEQSQDSDRMDGVFEAWKNCDRAEVQKSKGMLETAMEEEEVLEEQEDVILSYDNLVVEVETDNDASNDQQYNYYMDSEKEFLDIRNFPKSDNNMVVLDGESVELPESAIEDPLNIDNENGENILKNLELLENATNANEANSRFQMFISNNDLTKDDDDEDRKSTVENVKHFIDYSNSRNDDLLWMGLTEAAEQEEEDVEEAAHVGVVSVTAKNVSIDSDNLASRSNADLQKADDQQEEGDGSDSGLGSESSSTTLQSKDISLNDDNVTEGRTVVHSDTDHEVHCSSEAGTKNNLELEETITTSATTSVATTTSSIELNTATTLNSGSCTAPAPSTSTAAIEDRSVQPKPKRSNLKRRIHEAEVVLGEESDRTGFGILAPKQVTITDVTMEKKPKRSIYFDLVQIYYFPRQQGFSCVPSAGGCTLGMGSHHVGTKTMTLAEHAAELRRAHRLHLQEVNPRGSSSDDSEESEEDYLSEGSGSDLDAESSGFLQPVSPKQRRALLKAAGVRKIDPNEKIDCRNIRNSREICGCSCRDYCNPETCACSLSGIKCQVDRDMFPCGCSQESCGNNMGRIEFNPSRVRTHFIHTLMRLEMENRQHPNPYYVTSPNATIATAGVSLPVAPSPSTATPSYFPSHMQSTSNYSSGYASPAYNNIDQHQPNTNDSYYTQKTNENDIYGQQTSTLEVGHCDTTTGNSNCLSSSIPITDHPYGGLYDGHNMNASTMYGSLMQTSSSSYHSVNYINMETQVTPSYANNCYQNITQSYINSDANGGVFQSEQSTTAYSSCAVPSDPPYGTATTTECSVEFSAAVQLPDIEMTTAPSCTLSNSSKDLHPSTLLDSESIANQQYINLSTPLASSPHLTQINDLLQHNRHTTPALAAVSSPTSTLSATLDCPALADELTVTKIEMNAVDMQFSINNSDPGRLMTTISESKFSATSSSSSSSSPSITTTTTTTFNSTLLTENVTRMVDESPASKDVDNAALKLPPISSLLADENVDPSLSSSTEIEQNSMICCKSEFQATEIINSGNVILSEH